MDLFLSYESPPLITCIYVNSFRDCMMMDSIDTDFYLFISHWTVLLVPYFVLETMVTVCWGYLCFF